MINLHRLRGESFWLNPRHFELIEHHSNTCITLTNEKRYIVTETPDEIVDLIQKFEAGIALRITTKKNELKPL